MRSSGALRPFPAGQGLTDTHPAPRCRCNPTRCPITPPRLAARGAGCATRRGNRCTGAFRAGPARLLCCGTPDTVAVWSCDHAEQSRWPECHYTQSAGRSAKSHSIRTCPRSMLRCDNWKSKPSRGMGGPIVWPWRLGPNSPSAL